MSSSRLSLLAVLALFAGSALAALPDEIQVYTDDLEAPGETGVELHVNTTPSGRTQPAYPGEVAPAHGWRVTPEVSWGLTRDMDWGIYLPFVRGAEGTDYFAGPKFRLKWVPIRPPEGGRGWFAGVNGEVAFVERRFEEARRGLELRPILGWRDTDWLFVVNPILEADLAGEQKGVLTFAPAFKVARTVSNGRALGVEYYSELGRLSRFAPREEQEHTLFLVVDLPRVSLGIGRGLNNATDRWTLKAIFDF